MSARGLEYIVCCPLGCQVAPVACGAEDRPGDPGDGMAKLRAFLAMRPADRIALARALVADMPNVVVAEVREEMTQPKARELGIKVGYQRTFAQGFNACLTAIRAQKEPK